MRQSSGNTTTLAPALAARSENSRMRLALPQRSPTVLLVCARAIFIGPQWRGTPILTGLGIQFGVWDSFVLAGDLRRKHVNARFESPAFGSAHVDILVPAHVPVEVRVAALALIDMVKAVDPAAVISDVRVEEKTGGKTGRWSRP